MYTFAKKIVSKIISNEKLMQCEVPLRKVYALFYAGNSHQCIICNTKLRTFLQLPNHDLLCPKCGSLARDRRLWQILTTVFLKNGITVLDFSPSRSLARKLKKTPAINYISTDLSGNFIADFRYDITHLAIADASIDLIICYHVLEHIENDRKALSELYRVLKPGGKAIIQTPFKEGEIYENFSITSPAEKEIHFGQDDHVRIYSVSGLKERLEQAGFTADPKAYDRDVYYGLIANETVFVLTKSSSL
ncbi:MAG TPA: class I SAM-dependent methyltransferase [Cytophagaceae bacterium]|jgi:SAM-dependent methyltransferase|nr:class I SAM-dependent methyltransferase [Cytophagaceae bacterium]